MCCDAGLSVAKGVDSRGLVTQLKVKQSTAIEDNWSYILLCATDVKACSVVSIFPHIQHISTSSKAQLSKQSSALLCTALLQPQYHIELFD